MNAAYNNYESSFCHQLMYAKQKLMMPDVPIALKAIFYVRIYCNAMRQSHYPQTALNSDQIHFWNPQMPYLNLLGYLSQEVSAWWTTCYVSSDGLLESHNTNIHQLLKPVNAFIQAQLEPFGRSRETIKRPASMAANIAKNKMVPPILGQPAIKN